MSVEKRNGKYLVRWRDSSDKQRSKTVTLWRDAIKLDSDKKRQRVMGELITHERGTIRLNDFWEVWWTNYALMNLTDRSRAIYARLWKRHVAKALGSLRLRDVNRANVASLASLLSATMAPSSVRKVLAILQGVLERAVEWQYIATNPAKGVKRPKLVQRRGRTITEDELIALCKELNLRDSVIVAVLAYTGLRPGELRALRWCDLTTHAIHVEHAVSANQLAPTKTNVARTVPLNPRARTALLEWRMASVPSSLMSFVFQGRSTDLWTDRGWNHWQQEVFAPAAKRAGLAGLVPYDLRHTAISAMIHAGMDPARVARIAGHSLQTLLQTYAHEFESVYAERNAQLDNWQIPNASGGFGVTG